MESGLKVPFIDFGSFFHSIAVYITSHYDSFVQTTKDLAGLAIGIAIPLSLFFLIVIVYCVEQLKRIRNKEEQIYDLKVVPIYQDASSKLPGATGDVAMAKRWETVKAHITSTNPNDWRQAIIDADIMLDNLLSKMGYQGETVGEKLKRVAKGDFATLDDAWEAHKVRNMIAHQGSSVPLAEHDAKKAFDSYKRVFDEFYHV